MSRPLASLSLSRFHIIMWTAIEHCVLASTQIVKVFRSISLHGNHYIQHFSVWTWHGKLRGNCMFATDRLKTGKTDGRKETSQPIQILQGGNDTSSRDASRCVFGTTLWLAFEGGKKSRTIDIRPKDMALDLQALTNRRKLVDYREEFCCMMLNLQANRKKKPWGVHIGC